MNLMHRPGIFKTFCIVHGFCPPQAFYRCCTFYFRLDMINDNYPNTVVFPLIHFNNCGLWQFRLNIICSSTIKCAHTVVTVAKLKLPAQFWIDQGISFSEEKYITCQPPSRSLTFTLRLYSGIWRVQITVHGNCPVTRVVILRPEWLQSVSNYAPFFFFFQKILFSTAIVSSVSRTATTLWLLDITHFLWPNFLKLHNFSFSEGNFFLIRDTFL